MTARLWMRLRRLFRARCAELPLPPDLYCDCRACRDDYRRLGEMRAAAKYRARVKELVRVDRGRS